jgi:hypothetical protein
MALTCFLRSSVVGIVVVLLAGLVAQSSGFAIVPDTSKSSVSSSTSLAGFGDALKGAFSNDDRLGKPENVGLKGVCTKVSREVIWKRKRIALLTPFHLSPLRDPNTTIRLQSTGSPSKL